MVWRLPQPAVADRTTLHAGCQQHQQQGILGVTVVTVLLARFVLAAVFGVAGFAKLAGREGVRRSLGQLGVPIRLVTTVGGALVLSELGVAVGLLFGSFAQASGLAAVALLAGFSAVVALNLVRGRSPDCHCFGRLHSAPIAWSMAARNAVLACIALFVVADGRFPWVFVGFSVVAAVAWVALRPRRPREVGPGVVAPRFSLLDHEGVAWTLETLLAQGEPLILVFSNPGCGACRALLPDVTRWQRELAGRVSVAVVSGGSRAHNVVEARKHGLRRVLVDATRTVSTAYQVKATPSAIVIDRDHRIAATPAHGAAEIASMIAQVTARSERPRLGRRAVLRRAVAAAFAGTILPVIAAACESAAIVAGRPRQLEINGAYLCDQPYALCTSAACEPSESDPRTVICRCTVQNGYSIGYLTCAERAPTGDQLISTFSTQDATSGARAMTCPSGTTWANCLDVTCRVDPRNPNEALCQCERVETGEFNTSGGDCDTRTCASVIWSAASPGLPVIKDFETGMKQIGEPVTHPEACRA